MIPDVEFNNPIKCPHCDHEFTRNNKYVVTQSFPCNECNREITVLWTKEKGLHFGSHRDYLAWWSKHGGKMETYKAIAEAQKELK